MNYDNVIFKEYIEKKLEMFNDLGRIESDCMGVDCSDCPLSKLNNKTNYTCNELESLYPEKAIEIVMNYEPKVDWTKVPVDTKVLVRDCEEGNWTKRHFAKYEDGEIYTYVNGMSSFTTDETVIWNYGKLYKDE